MRKIALTLQLILSLVAGVSASETQAVLDSNTAFYEGETLNYVIPPPRHFKQAGQEAINDGYSFAFIPDSAEYADAEVIICVNIYKIRGLSFEDVLTQDTVSLRKHYGDSLNIWEVDSVTTATGDMMRTFYVNDKRRFIPNVMISYFDGKTELVIFELIISERVLRVNAEDIFIDSIRRFKALKRGELGSR